ncbi:MAG: anhydro-N-acetylmuramic acid kinase [Gammaproteobacteria bacterium]|jgi:anhydro-N-acetylmuramic acid kinase
MDSDIKHPKPSNLYIGLMSGTSLDSIDAALVSIEDEQCTLINSIEHPIPTVLRQQLISLCQPGNNEIDSMGEADSHLGQIFSEAVLALLKKSGNTPHDIVAIGSHGQTIRHRPSGTHAFTLQIGDPNTIAHLTQITTVADFRRRDVAAGGQGAPLAPAFHRAFFGSKQHNRAIINIGGIANITYLGSDGDYLAYDTGPGNTLLDAWISEIQELNYDHDGEWANTGTINSPLLNHLLSHPYFSQGLPKSTGREDFNLNWLKLSLENISLPPEDTQATLLELTAQSIISAVNTLSNPVTEIYICGGGAYNKALMSRLRALVATSDENKPDIQATKIGNTQELGIAAEWVEAAAFAWLAKQTIEGKTGNLRRATGASSEVILGAIYPV